MYWKLENIFFFGSFIHTYPKSKWDLTNAFYKISDQLEKVCNWLSNSKIHLLKTVYEVFSHTLEHIFVLNHRFESVVVWLPLVNEKHHFRTLWNTTCFPGYKLYVFKHIILLNFNMKYIDTLWSWNPKLYIGRLLKNWILKEQMTFSFPCVINTFEYYELFSRNRADINSFLHTFLCYRGATIPPKWKY